MPFTSGSPGSGLLEVGIALVLKDRFSNQAREASSQIKKLHLDAKNAVNANISAMQGIAKTGLAVSAGLGMGMMNAIEYGNEFIDTMISVKAITQTTDREISKLGDTAKDLGIKTMFNAQEIASGMKYLAMAGTKATDIHNIIHGAAMAANATGMELGGKGGSADMITNVMRMFRIEASGAASVVGDQLTKATLSSNMSMYDLAEAIKYAGADMVNLKQNLPSVTAMIGTLANAGIQGSMAGTAIANMARYLNKSITDPNYKGGKALARLGLSKNDFIDAKGDLIDFSIILGKIEGKMRDMGMTSTEIGGELLNIFGVRGNRAASIILRDAEGYRQLLNKIQNESKDFASEVVQQRMSSLAGRFDQLRESIANLKISFTTSVEPFIKPFVIGFTQIFTLVRRIVDIPVFGTIITGGLTAATVLTGVGSAVMLLRTKWLQFKNDSQVTTSSWMSILRGGWKGATLDAQKYLAIQTAIINQQKAGITGNMGVTMLAQGGWVGGLKMTKGKKGNVFFERTAEGGVRRIKESVAIDKASKLPPDVLTGTLLGSHIASTVAGKKVTPSGATVAKNAVGNAVKGRTLGVISKSLGGLLGLFGGPWGLAVTAGFMLLPPLISKISDSVKTHRENKQATENLNKTINQDMISRLEEAKKGKETSPEMLTIEMKNLARVIGEWGKYFSNPNLNAADINITLDEGLTAKFVDGRIKVNEKSNNFENNTR